jgi:hypothetical protein
MDIDRTKEAFSADGETLLSPRLFRHRDLISRIESSPRTYQRELINIINHIHFMDGHIFFYLNHPKYEEGILLKASPEPCMGSEVTCRWLNEIPSELKLADYQFRYLIIIDGQSIILAPVNLLNVSNEGCKVQLPEAGYILNQRQSQRFVCRGVTAEVSQTGFLANGKLVDFGSKGFRVRVDSDYFKWFNPDRPVVINLYNNKKPVLSGSFAIIRQTDGYREREIVLAPVDDQIKRFKKEEIRNPRQRLVPPPVVVFEHPFLKKRIKREISDISTSGFSVFEKEGKSVLMTGMIIREMVITYAGALKMVCTAQVIYRRHDETRKNQICWGIAILDMDIQTYSRLNHLLSMSRDSHACVSTEVDMDNLWEFFFETGFIYPKKYIQIQSHRDNLKETYRKLYQDNPEIARHFTYEKEGHIYGHLSMVRAYERAWLIQHHAAKRMGKRPAGLEVLHLVMLFLHGIYNLPSAKMDHVIACFQPGNEFPNLAFGDFARELNNPKGCSLDLFSYLTCPAGSTQFPLPEGWSLKEMSPFALQELEQFYKHNSEGLLLNVLDLGKRDLQNQTLEKDYEKLGFTRKMKVFSLIHRNNLSAVLIVNQSDLGLNLSEILNGIMAIVVDQEALSWEVLSLAVGHLTDVYHIDKIPLLIYPTDYIKVRDIPYDKLYAVWILNMLYSDKLMEHMQRKFGLNYE